MDIKTINSILESNNIIITFDLEIYNSITGRKVKTYKDKKNNEKYFYVNYKDKSVRCYYTNGLYIK